MLSSEMIGRLRSQVERLRSQEGGECIKCGKACVHCGIQDRIQEQREDIAELKAEKQELEQEKIGMMSMIDELRCQIAKLKEVSRGDIAQLDLAKLKAENQELEQEKIGMLAMIDKLRCQIAKLKEISQAAGHGNLMDKMMEESMLSETMRSEDMSCFIRLYQDALRRMKKWESLFTQQKLVATNQSPHELEQQFPWVLQHVSSSQQLEPLHHSPTASTTSLNFIVGLEGGRQGGGPADGCHGGSGFTESPFHSTQGFSSLASTSSSSFTAGRLPRLGAASSRKWGGAPLAGGLAPPLGRGMRNTDWPASKEADPRIEKGASAPLLGRAHVLSGAGYRSPFDLAKAHGHIT